jgi:hypothetical protein
VSGEYLNFQGDEVEVYDIIEKIGLVQNM